MKKTLFTLFIFASSLCAQVQLGKNVQIGAGAASGTVTQVDTDAASGISGGPITTTGTVACQQGSASQFGCVKADGTTITATGGVLSATGTGGSGVQYNPSTAAYLMAGSSLLIDDGTGVSTVLNVSDYSCNGTTCTVNLTAPYTPTNSAEQMIPGYHVNVTSLTGWPAPPPNVSFKDSGVGTFEIATATTTQFTFVYSTATPSCVSSCGTANLTSYWASYWAGQSQPYMWTHGKTYNAFGSAADLDTFFSTRINCTLGSPTYLIIQAGQNDIFAGNSAATIEGHLGNIWQKAHAAGCIVMQGTIVAFSGGFASSVQSQWNTMQDVNTWIAAQSVSPTTVAAGNKYWDQIIDYEAAMSNPTIYPPLQTSFSTNKLFGEVTNAMLAFGNNAARLGPPVGSISPYHYALTSWGMMFNSSTPWAFRDTGNHLWATFDPGDTMDMYQNNGAIGGSYHPLIKWHWPNMGANSTACNFLGMVGEGSNDIFQQCVHYVSAGSTGNWYSIENGSGTDLVRFLASGVVNVPGLASGGGTKLVTTDVSGNLGTTPVGSGTVTSSGTPAAGDLAAFTSPTDITTATVAQVNTLIKTLTGCNTPTFVYTPQSGTCVTPGTPTVPVGVNYTLNTGVAATPAAVLQTAPNSGTVTACAFTTTTSDGTTDLTFNLLLNGTSVLSGAACTVTHGATIGAIQSCTLTGSITVTAGQNWQLNVTAGTSSWTGSVACH